MRNLATAPWPYRMRDAEAFLASPRDPVLPSFLIFERTELARRSWSARAGSAGGRRARSSWAIGSPGRTGAAALRPRRALALIDIARDARPGAARRLALPRQSGLGAGAREARLRAARDHRSADELRARRRSAGAPDAAANWRLKRGGRGGAGGLGRAPHLLRRLGAASIALASYAPQQLRGRPRSTGGSRAGRI